MPTASKLTISPNITNINLGFDNATTSPAKFITIGLHSAATSGIGIAVVQPDNSYLLNFPVQVEINGIKLNYSSRFYTDQNNLLTLNNQNASNLGQQQLNATSLVVVDLDNSHSIATPVGNIILLANKAVGDAIITINDISTITAGQTFTVSGTLANYPVSTTSVTLVWSINNLNYTAAGTVTLTNGSATFSFTHPGISPLVSPSVLCIMDSNGLIAISNYMA